MPRTELQGTIARLLAAGLKQSEIAARLGVSRSVVSRTALRLGYRARDSLPTKYDWPAIRRYYEAGHSARECRERFGFSAGAWDQAVTRGDIVPRPGREPIKHAHATRKAVAMMLERGRSQTEIAAELGISKGTVAFHVRNLGVPPDRRFARRYDWAAVQQAYDEGLSAKECRERFGFSSATWTQAVNRGDIKPRPRAMPLSRLLVTETKRGRFNLKNRLLRARLMTNRCAECGITEWRGKPLNMALHHVNGDGLDNRLENLRLLCPNCHAQTPNYGGRNGHRRRRRTKAPP